MMPGVVQTLYRLQLLDTELSEQLSKLRETESLVSESAEFVAARRAHEQANKELVNWRTRLRDLELDLQALNDKIAEAERRLYGGRVTNPKELTGLQQDHEYLKRSCEKLEDDVLLAMTRLEECEQVVADAMARRADVEKRWQAEQNRLAKQIEQLQARIATLKKNRTALIARLGASDLASYEELLRKKGGRAVALLVGQMCQGCRVTVPASKAQLVRRGEELITCTNCGRILIAEP